MFVYILIAISVVLALTNFTPETILSGWDTLHPEFNLPLYLQRIFWGVWQQHQGLGAVAAQAHTSELGRLWYLWIPFRYGYFWLMLILGPLGVYKLLGGKKSGFLGGLFYLLNLGTMQHFYLPLEMFATAYGFLPWLFWAVLEKRTKILILLFLVSAPMAHTPTLWFVNFAALIVFAFFIDKKWSLKVFLIGLIVNSFWLLPTSYYVFTHGGDVANSHISQQFSAKAIATSKEFGNLFDISIIRGYLFDWGHFNFFSRQFADLFPVWKDHLAKFAIIGYVAFGAVLLGIFIVLKKRLTLGLAMLPVLILAIIGLLGVVDTEALRFPFTKFSLLLMLAFAVFFGIAADRLKKFWIIVPALLIFYMWPAFNGNLVCDCERVAIPVEYQQTFDWFNKQDHNTRIAPFPIDSIYGWGYYDWGYEGAGFRWFGLPQPILDREFDRWMPQNENYYWEISQAVYSKNLPLLESVLNKYRVNWLLVDKNIINPSSPKALYTDELERLVGQSDRIKLAKEFGKIKIYSYQLRAPTKSFISLSQNLPNVGPIYKWGNLDQGYFENGDYATKKDALIASSGDSGKVRETSSSNKVSVAVSINNVKCWLLGCGPEGNWTPGIKFDELIPNQSGPTPQTSIANYIYEYRTLFSGRSQADLEFGPAKLITGESIIDFSIKSVSDLSHRDGYLITVKAKNISGKPFLFWIEDLNSRRAVLETYLPRTQSLVTSYFVLPPMEPDGLGYTFHLDNNSVGKEISQNELESLEVWKIDYSGLLQQRVQDEVLHKRSGWAEYITNFQVEHPNPAWYRIDIGPHNASASRGKGQTLILAQSFEPGWIAIGVTSNQQVSRLGEHTLINNWANGWELAGNERIVYLFFWPQLLEFAGFGLLTIFIISLIIRHRSSNS